MTASTVPAILDAILDPLASITDQVQAALELARRNKLPTPFIPVIKAGLTLLNDAHDTLLDVAVALDPDLAKDQL